MFADAQVHKSGSTLHVTHGDDKECYVEFRMEPIHLVAKSEEQGRPIFEDQPFIRIMFPGDKTKVVDRPISEQDKQRFPNQYRAFSEQGVQVQSGTPITEWSILTRSQAMEYKSMGVHTIEQLAAVSDVNLTWLGAREYREKAKTWISASSDTSATVTKLMAEIASLRADLEASKEAPKHKPNK
jgi:hypothetical protein